MNKINWESNKEWLKEVLTKQGTEVKIENVPDKRKMVYYTSLPLIMQHNVENGGSSHGCQTSTSPTSSGGSLQIDLPHHHPHHHHQPQIINLSNNITLQAVTDQAQFGQHPSSLGAELMQSKLNGLDYSLPREPVHIISQPVPQVQSKSSKFKCDQCSMCFGSKSAHTSHMKSHAKQQQYQMSNSGNVPLDLGQGPRSNDQYQCDVCKKTFAVPARLIRHYRTHTGERPFECEFCHKMFSVKENLQVHRRIHTKERPYKCNVCERAFEHSGKLHRHMRIHTGERPHKCNVCGKTFIQSGQLVIHMRTHTGEKPYKCPEPGCGKGFTCSKQLKVHSRTHTGEKPYQCDICFRDFGYNHVLKLHRVQHYGSKCYKCTICDETFKNKKEMEAHIKGHANDIPDEEPSVQKVERFSPDEIVQSPEVAKDEVVEDDRYNYRIYKRFDSRVTSQYAVQSSMNPVALLAAASIVASAQERAQERPPSAAPSLSPVSLSPSSFSSNSYDLNKMRQTYYNHMAPTPEFKPLLQSSEELVKRVEAALGCTPADPETPPRSSPEDDRSSSPESDSPHMADRDNNTLPPRKRRLYFKDNQDDSTTTRISSVIHFAKAT